MGYRSLSTDMKNRAMELLNDEWTEIEVAEVFGVSVRSLRRWEDNFAVKGEINPCSVLRGHPRILDAAVMEDLWVLIEESPALYLDEIVDYLAVVHEIHISIITLHNNLQALGLTYRMMQCTASQRDEQICQAWRDDIAANFSREQFVFTSESSKDGRMLYRRFGCASWGKRPTEITPLEQGDRWSILPALTI
jgi:transposase